MPRNITCIFAVASLSLALLMSLASAVTIHVPGDQPTIQAGIDGTVGGDTVLVADGTYTGVGNRDIDLDGKAITIESENGSEFTILDCEWGGRGFNFSKGESYRSKIEGFTISNGSATLGGGIYGSSQILVCRSAALRKNYSVIISVSTEKAGGIK